MNPHEGLQWRESLSNTFEQFFSEIIAYAPQLLSAMALLFAGWVMAHALRIASKKLVRGFDSLFQRAAKVDVTRQERMKTSYSVFISRVVYWTVLLFFIAATGNLLGWNMFSSWMSSVILYLPNLITGLLIILAGFLFSNGAKTAVLGAASRAGISQSSALARLVQIVILLTALIIGTEQIGINVDFLTHGLIVILGVLLLGGTLAFGLGAKDLVANIIGAQYVRKHCRQGEWMQMEELEGSVVEVTQTTIVLDTALGRTLIPAKLFQERICSFKSREMEDAGPTDAAGETTP